VGGDLIQKEDFYLISGFHAVRESLIQGRMKIQAIWIAEGKKSARRDEILGIAKKKNISVHFKKGKELSSLLPDLAHQGIVALAEDFIYSDLNHVIDVSSKSKGHSLLIAADHITDEGNLGALIRTAAFFGVHGLIIPKDRSASVTSRVLKRSSGAFLHIPIAQVVNMGRALDILEKKGFWIIGASGDGVESIYQFDWKRSLVLVLGNEQKGLGRAVRKRCQQVVRIPSPGQVESLNVGVAAGVILSEITKPVAD